MLGDVAPKAVRMTDRHPSGFGKGSQLGFSRKTEFSLTTSFCDFFQIRLAKKVEDISYHSAL